MPKKMKLKLNELKVKSFVTVLEGNKQNVRAGEEVSAGTQCESCGGTCETCFGSCAGTCPNTMCGGQCETLATDCTCNSCPPICTNTCDTCETCNIKVCPW